MNLEDAPAPERETIASCEDGFDPVREVEGDPTGGLLLICDHASNAMPARYGTLGLGEHDLSRHIAYDVGAAAVTADLARRLRAPAVLGCFSRLLIDPNRGEDDPTLIMRLSDRAVIPGNRHVDAAERERRLEAFYRPYHRAVHRAIEAAIAAGRPPAILSVHSFTAIWRGWPRPWHCGVLWDADPRFPLPLIEALRGDRSLVVGDNEPYTGALKNDTLYRHGTARGLAHALIEIRNDLICEPSGVSEWGERLEPMLRGILERENLDEVRVFGSETDEPALAAE